MYKCTVDASVKNTIGLVTRKCAAGWNASGENEDKKRVCVLTVFCRQTRMENVEEEEEEETEWQPFCVKGCHIQLYCDDICQRMHWCVHKQVCCTLRKRKEEK